MNASPASIIGGLQPRLAQLDAADASYATRFVDSLLQAAQSLSVSDVHLQPTPAGLEVRWRLDGVLQSVGTFPRGQPTDIVTRLKVLAELLTYRTDIPQEGRIRQRSGGVEMRVSTFPTLHGERAVVRLFAADHRFVFVDDLGFPTEVAERWKQLLAETAGALLITGPAGSGKTTTAYACLRDIVCDSQGRRSLVSLEDPIEVAVEGVSQSQANPAAGFELAAGLKSLLRQDPEVMLIGEIRDRSTAETAFQAALTGHLVISTFHAGSAAEAINRVSDMGIEPYLLRSGLLAILNQRLARRLCECAAVTERAEDFYGLPLKQARRETGCPRCLGTGYGGRLLLVEMLEPTRDEVGRAILSRQEAAELERLAVEAGMVSRWQRALDAAARGDTSPAEIRRVLGFADSFSASRR